MNHPPLLASDGHSNKEINKVSISENGRGEEEVFFFLGGGEGFQREM